MVLQKCWRQALFSRGLLSGLPAGGIRSTGGGLTHISRLYISYLLLILHLSWWSSTLYMLLLTSQTELLGQWLVEGPSSVQSVAGAGGLVGSGAHQGPLCSEETACLGLTVCGRLGGVLQVKRLD